MRGEAAGGAGKPGAPGMRRRCAGWVQQGPPKHSREPGAPTRPCAVSLQRFLFLLFSLLLWNNNWELGDERGRKEYFVFGF